MSKKATVKAEQGDEGMTDQQKKMALVSAGFNEMQIKVLMRVFG